MFKLLIQAFVAVFLLLSSETYASVKIPSDDSDLTKSILDENPTSGISFCCDGDEEEQTSVKSYSENQNSDIYGQTHADQLNEQLSVLDVLFRKRRTEASAKSEEKVFEIPHADKLPIKTDSEYVTSNNPSSVDDKPVKDLTEERAHVRPVTFKLTSSTNEDGTTIDKQLDDDKANGESVKIIVSPIGRALL